MNSLSTSMHDLLFDLSETGFDQQRCQLCGRGTGRDSRKASDERRSIYRTFSRPPLFHLPNLDAVTRTIAASKITSLHAEVMRVSWTMCSTKNSIQFRCGWLVIPIVLVLPTCIVLVHIAPNYGLADTSLEAGSTGVRGSCHGDPQV